MSRALILQNVCKINLVNAGFQARRESNIKQTKSIFFDFMWIIIHFDNSINLIKDNGIYFDIRQWNTFDL